LNVLDDVKYLDKTYVKVSGRDGIYVYSRQFIGTSEENHTKSQYILHTGGLSCHSPCQ